ncbi:peptidoglycan D,D-transpeptidase FtsI family protein [Natronincola ferrireducens]|uniref:Peptidoglycan glycosyltransferase n=1 Tax=Natronincola ferrireducens TaxID=393762 RepID=A0A1G9CM82_9FIRM|nr:penicillin-binding transpeptidase domain-containing protein [Natronincola ferrireducens]SDK52790.1 peptidoglycan glycosyltransferase [Natronincola ferrireducens]
MRKEKRNQTEKVYIKRLLFIGALYSIIVLLLIGRLFYIQVLRHDFYVKEVNRQRQLNIPINSGRGILFDRNFIPLTDRNNKKIAVIFPQLFVVNEEGLDFLSQITGENPVHLGYRIGYASYPIEIPITEEIDWQDRRILNTRGLFIVDKRQRYENYPVLTHVIGYINQVDKKGMAGLEKSLDHLLMGTPTQILAATLDGRKRFLPGEGFSVVSSPLGQKDIRLTIDYLLQKIAEEVMDQEHKEGAIIISNVETGEILAMVSRPNYNPNTIAKHIESSGDELFNKGIQMTFPPGSIFKIVVAAAAIEKEMVALEETFYCTGSEQIGNIEIRCNAHNRDGNGEITFEKAFAESCNSVFIQLGQKLGAESIIEAAKRFGFGEKIDIGLQEEEIGNLPSGDHLLGPAIGNIAIGQGTIEVTPLQVNQMTQIIANNGMKKNLHILKDILNNYEILETFDTKDSYRVLSQKNAKQLQKLMETVMMEGTGKNIGQLAKTTAGKTGTAQAAKRGNTVLHAWFTGYYPATHPEYAITVLIQEGGSGGAVAVPVFQKILEKMMAVGY